MKSNAFFFLYSEKYLFITSSQSPMRFRLFTLPWYRWPLPLPLPFSFSQIIGPRADITSDLPCRTNCPLPVSSPTDRKSSANPTSESLMAGAFFKKVFMKSGSMPSVRCNEYHRGSSIRLFNFAASKAAISLRHFNRARWLDFWLSISFLARSTWDGGPPLEYFLLVN